MKRFLFVALFFYLVELPYSTLGKTSRTIEKILLQTSIFAVTLHSEKRRRAPFPSEEIPDKNDKPYFFRAKKHSE